MKKLFYTFAPWALPPKVLTHTEVAQAQLEEARIRLLEEEQAKERAMANCEGLRARIRRLEAYIRENNSKLNNPAVQ